MNMMYWPPERMTHGSFHSPFGRKSPALMTGFGSGNDQPPALRKPSGADSSARWLSQPQISTTITAAAPINPNQYGRRRPCHLQVMRMAPLSQTTNSNAYPSVTTNSVTTQAADSGWHHRLRWKKHRKAQTEQPEDADRGNAAQENHDVCDWIFHDRVQPPRAGARLLAQQRRGDDQAIGQDVRCEVENKK